MDMNIVGKLSWLLLLVLNLAAIISATPPQVDNFGIRSPIPRIEDALTPVTMYLDCSGTGDPIPTYQFKRNGIMIDDAYPDKRLTVKDNTLQISRLNTSDGGFYTCLASNQDGTVLKEIEVKLRVLGQFVPESRSDKDARNHAIALYKHTTIKCPTHSHTHPSIIEWGSVPSADNPRARITRIPISNRVFYGNDGSLHFANVIPEDLALINNDYRGIQCLLSVGLGTRASNRFKLRQDDNFGTSYTSPANLATSMPKDVTILKDQESIFTCGGFGRPTPTVTWYKDGVRIQNIGNTGRTNFAGYTLSYNDVELKIVRPRKEDEGVFRCVVENTRGKKETTSNLLVHFKPYWVKEIFDISLPVDGSTLFNCSAIGKPIATYEWYKNGTLLTPSNHIKIDSGVLQIVKARLTDKGMYVCMGRNKHGTITTQSFVNVQAIKPVFVERYPDPMYLYRGRRGKLYCNPTGGPTPRKTWYKNNQLVNLKLQRYSQDVNGSLIISLVDDTDRGQYKCVAANIRGRAEMVANVQIVAPTKIVVAPQAPNGGSTVKQGRDLVLVCNATYDPNLQLRIHWEKDGERIKTFDSRFMLERRVGDAAPRLLIINPLKFEDRGNYTCKAYTIFKTTNNIGSEDVSTHYLSVSAPPDAPTSLKFMTDCTNYKPLLQWRVGESNNDFMRFVTVEYKSEYPDDVNTWYVAGSVDGESVNQYQFKNIPGNARLMFRATAYNQVGASLPSLPTAASLCVTLPKRPENNPVNVSLVVVSASESDIVWGRMKIIEQEGTDFKYEVSYRVVGAAKFTQRNVTNSTYSLRIRTTRFTQYEVCVRAYNNKGPSVKLPNCIKAYSYQANLTAAPTGLRPSKIGYTDVDLTWNSVVYDSAVNNVKGYRIYYWNITKPYRPVIVRGEKKRRRRRAVVLETYPTAKKPYMVEYLIGSDVNNLKNVSGLIPALRYQAYITAFNSAGEGPRSSTIVFETRVTKSGIPDNIKMTVYGDVLHVQWEAPLEPNGITTGYIIELDPKRDSQSRKKLDHIVVDKIEREYYIRGMTPCKFYRVKIAVMNQNGEGRYYERRMAVSMPDKPGRPNLPRVVPYDANAVNVTYKLPGYGGLPTSFTIYYKSKDAAYYDSNAYFNPMAAKADDFRKRPWQTVKGLPELEYAFWTVGHNSLGDSVNSDRVVSQVMPYTRPGIRTTEGPWYSSRWFVGALACVIFILILLSVILILINKHGSRYTIAYKEKIYGVRNGEATTEFTRFENEPNGEAQQPTTVITTKADIAPHAPDYQRQSSIEKKPPSDDMDEQYSLEDYGEDSRFQEDSSFIGQYGEEKRREAEQEEEEESDEPDDATFV